MKSWHIFTAWSSWDGICLFRLTFSPVPSVLFNIVVDVIVVYLKAEEMPPYLQFFPFSMWLQLGFVWLWTCSLSDCYDNCTDPFFALPNKPTYTTSLFPWNPIVACSSKGLFWMAGCSLLFCIECSRMNLLPCLNRQVPPVWRTWSFLIHIQLAPCCVGVRV